MRAKMRYYYDCEFLEDGHTIDLISIGVVGEDGREYYAVVRDAPWDRIRRHPWLMRNVVPSLPGSIPGTPFGVPADQPDKAKPGQEWFWCLDSADACVKPKWVIANEVREFLLFSGDTPELWAWYADYDHVALCQLWGPMIDLPKGIPMLTKDLKQRCEDLGNPGLPEQPAGKHNALDDARHNVVRARFLGEMSKGMSEEPRVVNSSPDRDEFRVRKQASADPPRVVGLIGEHAIGRPPTRPGWSV